MAENKRHPLSTRERTAREYCDKCRHFTGVSSGPDGNRIKSHERGQCRALVFYDEVRGPQASGGMRLPCFRDGEHIPCEKRSFKTPEELDAEVAERDAHHNRFMEQMTVIRPAIIAHANGKRGVAGEFPCPSCKTGMRRYSISGYNGHIHSRCSTEGCASWME